MYVVIYSPLTCTYTGMALPFLYSCSVGTSWKEKSSRDHFCRLFSTVKLFSSEGNKCYYSSEVQRLVGSNWVFFQQWKFNRAMWQLMLFWRGPKTGLYTSVFFTGETLFQRHDNWKIFEKLLTFSTTEDVQSSKAMLASCTHLFLNTRWNAI